MEAVAHSSALATSPAAALATSPAAEGEQEELILIVTALVLVSALVELIHAGPAAAAGGSMASGAGVLTGQQIFEKAAKKAPNDALVLETSESVMTKPDITKKTSTPR